MWRVLATFALLCACVGTNPWWDGPDDPDAPHVATDGNDDGETGDASTSAGAADDDSAAVDEASEDEEDDGEDDEEDDDGEDHDGEDHDGSGDTTDGAGGEPPAPVCEAHQVVCSGECRNVDKDKHFCGPACIDCTVRFGNNARCEDGECAPH